MIAKLPIYLYQDTPEGPIEISDHPAFSVVSKMPSDLHTPFELRQLMETGKGLGGNGYARVFRDGSGDPISLQWLEPCYVSPRLVKRPNGERFVAYYVEGETMPLTRYDILHVRGFSKDGVCGLSPIRLLRESIGTALAQTEAAGRLMRDGTQFPGFLVAQQSLKADVLADARDEFQRNYGGPQNAGKVPVLNGNFDFKQTNGMSMVDAQFIESRRFELQEIARLYRIPAFMVGDTTASTTWGSGIEQQTLGFLNFSLDPHLVSWEQSLGHTLLTTEEMRKGYYFRFDRDQLANVALEARANFFQTMRNIGVFSPNDIRAKLEEPLISAEEGGDSYGMPLASNAGAAPIPQPQEV
jgi:HK97 family phage portal protein